MDQLVKTYQRSVTMQMEDWLQDPMTRDEVAKTRLLGLAVAVIGTRAALNNKVLHSDEYKAVCKMVQDFSGLSKEEAAALTYFATLTRDTPEIEELSIDITTQEFDERDFIQLLDRLVEILEMDGVLCSEDARLLSDLYELIQRCIDNCAYRKSQEKGDFMSSVRIFVDSVLEEVDADETMSLESLIEKEQDSAVKASYTNRTPQSGDHLETREG